MKTILAPVDFSPVTAAVADEAIHLAQLIKGRLIFVHVVEPPSRARDVFPAGELSAEVLLAAKKAAEASLEKLRKTLHRRYPALEMLRLTGNPVECVVEEANKCHAGYLVIGSHGHGAVYDLLVGSVARGVLLAAPCPVLVVSASKAANRKVPEQSLPAIA